MQEQTDVEETEEEAADGSKYTPLFRNSKAEVFLPYEEAMFPFRSWAKRFGSSQKDAVLKSTGLLYDGKIMELSGEKRYPMVEIQIDEEGNKGFVAIVGGPAYDELMAIPSNVDKSQPLDGAEETLIV